MTNPRPLLRLLQKGLACVLVASLSTGCSYKAWTVWPTLGIRPNEPDGAFSANVQARCNFLATNPTDHHACLQYHEYREWGLELAEAYRSRATLNEWGLTASALVALAGAGALTGLAAFGATASDAYKIIPLAGGFVSGVAAWFDNKKRAKDYTEAANTIMAAIGTSEKKITSSPNASSFFTASEELYSAISGAQNNLENKRNEQLGTADIQELKTLLQKNTTALDELKSTNADLKKQTEELQKKVERAREVNADVPEQPTQ